MTDAFQDTNRIPEDDDPEYQTPIGKLSGDKKSRLKTHRQPERDIDHEIRMKTDPAYRELWAQLADKRMVRKLNQLDKPRASKKRKRRAEAPAIAERLEPIHRVHTEEYGETDLKPGDMVHSLTDRKYDGHEDYVVLRIVGKSFAVTRCVQTGEVKILAATKGEVTKDDQKPVYDVLHFGLVRKEEDNHD